MLELSHPSYNTFRQIAAYLKLAAAGNGILIQTLSYNDTRRLINIDGAEVTRRGDDHLGELLTGKLDGLCDSTLIDPKVSLASLFESGALQRSLKAKVFLAHDLWDEGVFVGVLVSCKWLVDEDLGTNKFTPEHCAKAGLPDFSAFVLVDIFCSVRQPAATLLLLSTFVSASRMKPAAAGLCAVAINSKAKDLFAKIGFHVHPFRERGQNRWLCYVTLGEFSNLPRIMERVRFSGHKHVVTTLCNRMAVRGDPRVVHRC